MLKSLRARVLLCRISESRSRATRALPGGAVADAEAPTPLAPLAAAAPPPPPPPPRVANTAQSNDDDAPRRCVPRVDVPAPQAAMRR